MGRLRTAIKKGVKVGIKAAAVTSKESLRALRPMIRKGKLSRAEARRATAAILRVANKQRKRAEAKLENAVAAQVRRLGLVEGKKRGKGKARRSRRKVRRARRRKVRRKAVRRKAKRRASRRSRRRKRR